MNSKKNAVSEQGRQWLKDNLKGYSPFIAVLAIMVAVTTCLSLAFSYLTGYVVNGAVSADSKAVVTFAVVLASITVIRVSISVCINFLAERFRAKIFIGLRSKLFLRILKSEYSASKRFHSGELVNRLTNDCSDVASASINLVPNIVGMCLQAVGAVVALATLDWLFTVVYFGGGLLIGGVTVLLRKKLKSSHKRMTQAEGEVKSYMQESILSSLLIKAYSAEEKSCNKLNGYLNTYFSRRMEKNVISVTIGGMFSFVNSLSMIFAVVWCSVKLMMPQPINYGSILSIVLLIGQLERPISAFSGVMSAYFIRLASAERLAEVQLLGEEKIKGVNTSAVADGKTATNSETATDGKTVATNGESTTDGEKNGKMVAIGGEIKADCGSVADIADGDIVVDNITFSYGDKDIFNGACASISKGEIVCITGESGSGKSTLCKLLLSVYSPQSGRLTVGGREIEPYLRPLFAYVPQGNWLFSGTIEENLTIFADGANSEDIASALEVACANFVYDLPKGLQSTLSECGGGLSEGQVQRLAVARAIISKRPILLLDEATSSLDEVTEKNMLCNIKNLTGKTCIIITHRPRALSIADRVLSVKDGKITEVAKGGV